MVYILPDNVQYFFHLGVGVIFFILPIFNHVRIVIAIRRHNCQVHDAVSGQNSSLLFQREKNAAINLFVIVATQMLCMAPTLVVNVFEGFLCENFQVIFAWSTSLVFVNSSINPVIYLVRSREIRDAVRSMLCI